MSGNPKLCKALETLVDHCKSIDGRTRILKMVYLADKAWHAKHRSPYTEAKWFRWNHGPYAREVLGALEWMDGVEIVEKVVHWPTSTGYVYVPGPSTRLSQVRLDPEFERELRTTATKWQHESLKKLLAHVYSDSTFDKTMFGDRLLT